MSYANLVIKQILLKRGNTVASSAYTGPLGEVLIDVDLKTLRIQDGVHAGGHTLATSSDVSNIANIVNTITGFDSNIISNINSILGNLSSNSLVNGSYTATLQNTGTLSLPGAVTLPGSITWPGNSTIYEDSELVLQNPIGIGISSPNSTSIAAGSNTWTFDNTGRLYTSGFVLNPNNNNGIVGATGNVHINAGGGDYDWNFNGTDGSLSIPGSITQPIGSNRYWTAAPDGSNNGSINVNWGVDGFNAGLYLNKNNAALASTGLPVVIDVSNNTTNYLWQFSTSGVLTTPGDISVTGNISLSNGIIRGGNLTVTDTNDTITAISLGSTTTISFTNNVFEYPTRGQITISGISTTSQANGTWYYEAVNNNAVSLFTDNTYTSEVDSSSWTPYTSTDGLVAITQDIPGESITLDANGYLTTFSQFGQLQLPTYAELEGQQKYSLVQTPFSTDLRFQMGGSTNFTLSETGNLTLPASTGKVVFPYNVNSNAIIDYSQDGGQFFIIQNNYVDGYQGINLDTDDGYVQINSKNTGGNPLQTWRFNTNGQMQFPDGSYQTTAWLGSTPALVNGSYTVSLGNDGYLNLNNGLDGQGALIQSLSPIRINSNSYFWTFGADGHLTFPDSTVQTTAYRGPSGQTDFATNAAIVTANTAMKSYVDSSIYNVQYSINYVNNNVIPATISQVNTAMLANVNAANVAWQANATAQQAQITTLQTQVYSNVNTAAYLAANPITVSGNLTAGNLLASGYFFANGQPFVSSNYGNTNVAAYLLTNANTSLWTANINLPYYAVAQTSNDLQVRYHIGTDGTNDLHLSPQVAYGGNESSYIHIPRNSVASSGLNLINSAGPVVIGQGTYNINITGNNLSSTGNISAGNVNVGKVQINGYGIATSDGTAISVTPRVNFTNSDGIYATGIVFAGNGVYSNTYNWSNGVSILTGIGGTYSNSNVGSYLLTYGGNITTANIFIPNTSYIDFNNTDKNWRMGYSLGAYTKSTAQTTLDVVVGQGSVGPDGFTVGQTGGQSIFELNGYTRNAYFSNSVTASGNINGTYINGTTGVFTGNVSGSNISGTTIVSAGNITAANINGNSFGTTATYTGNITAANIVTTGSYGNITGANVISANTIVVNGVNLTRATNGYNNWKGNTYANLDNISASVFSNGQPAFGAVSGTLNYFWSATSVLSGHPIIGNTSTGGSVSTSQTSYGLPWAITSGGDTVTAVVQDQGLGRAYNITYMQTVGTGNCAIVVERII